MVQNPKKTAISIECFFSNHVVCVAFAPSLFGRTVGLGAFWLFAVHCGADQACVLEFCRLGLCCSFWSSSGNADLDFVD